MSNAVQIVRCFLCRQKGEFNSTYKPIDETLCPASKKHMRSVLSYLASLSGMELHIARDEWICCNCFFQISEYDAYLIRTVKKQKELLQLMEKAMMAIDSDFDEECAADMMILDNELQYIFDDVQVGDDEIKNTIREALGKKRKRMDDGDFEEKAAAANDCGGFQCSFCAMDFKSKTAFQKHMTQSHKKFSCELCDFSHRNEDYVLLHMNLHEGRNENQCRYCDKEFTTKISTIRHMECHLDTKKYQCDKCGLCFSQTTVLYNHKLQHEAEEKPLRCEICMQMFKTKRTYRHHLITHRADRPRHTCEYCGRNFTEKYTLKVHKRTHHEESEMSRGGLEEPVVVGQHQQAVSEVIISTTETEEICTAELQHSTNPPTNASEIGKDRFNCIICDQMFLSRDQMNKHMERDHDVILKSLAFNNFSQYEVVCNEEKKQCHICSQTFCTQHDLDYHLENVHGLSFK